MRSLIELSLSTMENADFIKYESRDKYERGIEHAKIIFGLTGLQKFKQENDFILNTKILIVELYDNVCYWLCSSQTHKDHERLFRAIVRSFLYFSNVDKDKYMSILKEELKLHK